MWLSNRKPACRHEPMSDPWHPTPLLRQQHPECVTLASTAICVWLLITEMTREGKGKVRVVFTNQISHRNPHALLLLWQYQILF